MFSENNLLYILTILEAIEKIKIYTAKYDKANDFMWDDHQRNFNASVNLLIAIGEESKKIDNNLKTKYPGINWKAIAGMRDKLAHDYRGIDPEITWEIIKNNLDDLKDTLVEILKGIDSDNEVLLEALKSEYYKHLDYLK